MQLVEAMPKSISWRRASCCVPSDHPHRALNTEGYFLVSELAQRLTTIIRESLIFFLRHIRPWFIQTISSNQFLHSRKWRLIYISWYYFDSFLHLVNLRQFPSLGQPSLWTLLLSWSSENSSSFVSSSTGKCTLSTSILPLWQFHYPF